jgi:hypothetical protein
MNKIILALLLGGSLGALDGLSALLSDPSTAPVIAGIVVGSSIKGLLTGLIVGLVARRSRSVRPVVILGLSVSLALAFAIALAQYLTLGVHHWWQIMLPGALVGVLVGYGTQTYGRSPMPLTSDRAG